MRSPPPALTADRLAAVLADGWDLHATSLAYVPEGGGSHHWALDDPAAGRRFITVDDLTQKPWTNQHGNGVYGGLRSALSTAATLRDQSGLRFVVAPYTVSVFPFVAGAAFPFGRFARSRRVIASASAAGRSLRASCCGLTDRGPAVSSPRMHALPCGPPLEASPGCWLPSTGLPPLPAQTGRPAR